MINRQLAALSRALDRMEGDFGLPTREDIEAMTDAELEAFIAKIDADSVERYGPERTKAMNDRFAAMTDAELDAVISGKLTVRV